MENKELSTKEKAKIAQREYMRQWRKQPGNKEKAKEYQQKHFAKKYDEMMKEAK